VNAVPWYDEDLIADGPAEKEFHAGIAARQPRHRAASGALIRNRDGHLLMVEPTYKPTWDLPGGMVEDSETPREACQREVNEELGIDLPPGRLLVIDWVPPQCVWSDEILFIFDGGILSDTTSFALQADELAGVKFVSLAEASAHVRPSMARRLARAVDAASTGTTAYLEFGRAVAEQTNLRQTARGEASGTDAIPAYETRTVRRLPDDPPS
jgi:8-oxo-dGTP pyrophosphatase MutT (NUDIX family)